MPGHDAAAWRLPALILACAVAWAQPTAAQPTAAQPTAAQPTAAQPPGAQPPGAPAPSYCLVADWPNLPADIELGHLQIRRITRTSLIGGIFLDLGAAAAVLTHDHDVSNDAGAMSRHRRSF